MVGVKGSIFLILFLGIATAIPVEEDALLKEKDIPYQDAPLADDLDTPLADDLDTSLADDTLLEEDTPLDDDTLLEEELDTPSVEDLDDPFTDELDEDSLDTPKLDEDSLDTPVLADPRRPHPQPKVHGAFGYACTSRCTNQGQNYFWCWAHSHKSWDYCSPNNADLTAYHRHCKPTHACGHHGQKYTWCYTTTHTWDYCVISRAKPRPQIGDEKVPEDTVADNKEPMQEK